MSSKTEFKRTAKILKALGNAHRLQVVQLLLSGEKNVSQINKDIRISQPSLSQHLAKLKREGLLGSRRDQRQIFYYVSNSYVPSLLAISAELAQGGGATSRRAASRAQDAAVPSLASQFELA